jgi:hypothetical protein
MTYIRYTAADRANPEAWATLQELAQASGAELVPAVINHYGDAVKARVAELVAQGKTISRGDRRGFLDNLKAVASGRLLAR